MLALLERCVTDLCGTYAMEDTDSMAIVATQRGGLIECEGGTHRKGGKPAITALSWAQVASIAKRFEALNPYDRSAIPGSVLKIEDDNFDPKTGRQRQLCCLAISAKRYTLFLRDQEGEPALLREGVNNKEDRYSEHGLGICSIPPIRRARIATGSPRPGFRSCADRWASPRSRCVLRSGLPWDGRPSAAPR